MVDATIDFIKSLYPKQDIIPLHAPVFLGNEKKYLGECIDTSYVSYLGNFVNKMEEECKTYTGVNYAVSLINGTSALHIALKVVGVEPNTEVITQALTFVATSNSIFYNGAYPTYIDVDKDNMGLCPEKLQKFLEQRTEFKNGNLINKVTKRKISAVLPVHVFGHPCYIERIVELARSYNLPIVEDAAEGLGSFYKNKHIGTFGDIGVISFNGNKIITTGGGGMILTNYEKIAEKIKHITTTAKVKHDYEYVHDEIGYNFRMANINAAIGLAQFENISEILNNKRNTANLYREFFEFTDIGFISEPDNSTANYWLNAIKLKDKNERDEFIKRLIAEQIMVRPIWRLNNKLKMFNKCYCDDLINSNWIEEKIVNIPSSFRKL
ncbi:MAG: LegC family aminotransferase [Rhodothermaceae bacterium]